MGSVKSSSAQRKVSKQNGNPGEGKVSEQNGNPGGQDSQSQPLIGTEVPKPRENQSYDQLKEYLPVFCMDIRQEVDGDGNCFFHAVADQLKRLGLLAQSAADLRMKLVKFLPTLDPKDPISESLPVPEKKRKEYLDKLAEDGTWVEGVAVAGTAKMLKRDVIVVKSTEVGYMVSINKGGTGEKLLLGLVDQHFISLRSCHDQPAGAGSDSIDQDPARQGDASSSFQVNPGDQTQTQQSDPQASSPSQLKPSSQTQTQQSVPWRPASLPNPPDPGSQPQQSDPSGSNLTIHIQPANLLQIPSINLIPAPHFDISQ